MPEARPHVVVVGSINSDLTARVRVPPRPGETVTAMSLSRSAGGKGANQAVAAARAGGVPTTLVGAVGDDPEGRELTGGLRDAGVALELVTSRDAPTGVAIVTVDQSGENSIVVVPGANGRVDANAAAPALSQAHVVLVQLEIPMEQVQRVTELAPAASIVVVNAAPVAAIPPVVWDRLDVLIVNDLEATALAGVDDLDRAIEVLGRRAPCVVITRGDEGCDVLVGRQTLTHLPAHPARVVDTTGAGDTFCGVLAAKLAAGMAPTDAARWAQAAAALSVGRPGAQESIPSVEEVSDFLRRHEGTQSS